MKSRTGRVGWVAVGAIVFVMGVWAGVLLGVVSVGALDLHTPHADNAGLNVLYEDNSFIVSVGTASVAGCIPFSLCSEIEIDSPWEDFLPSPLSDAVYFLIDLAYKR